jgi:hypothetical protein
LQDQIKRGGKNVTVIGSPWLYNLKMNSQLFENPKSSSKKVIAYPLHSQPWAPKNYQHLDYAKYLKENYGEVSVCLHWSEFSNKEVTSTYESLGHKLVTNGVGTPWLENFDSNFLDKQLNLLGDHGLLVTNAMQTSVLYALSLGLKVEFGGQASWVKKIDEVGTYGENGQDYWKEQVMNNPDSTWKIELGFKELLEPTKLKQVLGWDKQQSVTLGFIKSRAIDLVRDGSIVEKLSYLAKE